MVLLQFGIFAQGTHAHYFLEFGIRDETTPEDIVKSFRRLRSPDVTSGGVNFVLAFGSKVWHVISKSVVPESLSDFQKITGIGGRSAPATQHDAWVWISGGTPDVVWDHSRASVLAVMDVAKVATEQAGFTYRHSRDETGFFETIYRFTSRLANR